MVKRPDTEAQRQRRHRRVRGKIEGTASRPRLNVFRSLNHIYAQVIDDAAGTTLCAASSLDKEFKGKTGGNKEAAREVGKLLGNRAVKAGVKSVVFDRGGYLYHGRVKELADGAREAGLEF
jgi:large subunit ribosomal protein L18